MQNTELVEEEVLYEYKYKKIDIRYAFFKRLIDIVCSFLGIIVLSPILLIVAIAIKLESKGAAIFVQDRVGFRGKEFRMYKFRSMVVDAEELKDKLKDKNEMNGPMFKIKKDPRVTKVGSFIRRTSIDELPQLINVLKGEMSLVGPRPSLPGEVKEFELWMMERFSVKPGLTCYWQVSGRNDIGFYEWMELDVKYAREKSILGDIKLIIRTFLLLFGDKHAS
ncbi:sugar transferase [Clostridium sp. Sa3CVN1]|uniref:Sugar transferase n=1 Tax=Clostridium cibarium TaxID=2762247 RepID=A0ABR8PUH9_9CLOT|nr:sugar transferase [Clostridium cibarium]